MKAIEVFRFTGNDGVPVVQIDTTLDVRKLRVNVNEGTVYDGDPEAEQGVRVTRTKAQTASLMENVQLAQNAAMGDSNDDEIDLLRGALEQALQLLDLELPEPTEED